MRRPPTRPRRGCTCEACADRLNGQGAILLELFTHHGVGTMLTADPVQKLRAARVEDIASIIALIEPLEADGTLVKRSRELLEREIGNFQVIEHDGVLLGCAALYQIGRASCRERV